MNFKTSWYQLVEINIPTAASMRVYFPDQPQLRTQIDQEIIIRGVELVPFSVLTASPSGVTNAPLTELVKGMITFNNDDTEMIYQFPIIILNRTYGDPATDAPHQQQLQEFSGMKNVAWSKSYIQFTQAPASTPYSLLFGVHYDKLPGQAIKTF